MASEMASGPPTLSTHPACRAWDIAPPPTSGAKHGNGPNTTAASSICSRVSAAEHQVARDLLDARGQALRERVDATISTLPSCVDAAHPDLYEPITIGEHIGAKLAGSRAGKRNERAERESARVLASQRT